MDAQAFVNWFRQAGPYINAHRGKIFVVGFGGEAVAAPRFDSLIHDIALLHSLGVKLVLAHGAHPQIDARLREANQEPRYDNGLRITDEHTLPYVKEAIGSVRIRIEALLSMGLANSPMQGARIRVASGNVVTARPLGVRNGVDYGLSGEVRRIDNHAIEKWLDSNALVLLSPLGFSPTGEVFNLSAEDVATATAGALRADKLLLLYDGPDLTDESGTLIRQINPSYAQHLLDSAASAPDSARHLGHAVRACRSGVRRAHLLNRTVDGVLLLELFTRDGVGTMVSADIYEGLRMATIDDVGGLLELLRPLEDAGILVRRSRELLEIEIDRFTVVERDGAIIGCAALYPFAEEHIGELACVAIDPDYRDGGRAEALLRFIEDKARKQGLQRLFVLTTQTAQWFQERGFTPAALTDLPVKRQEMYNFQRRSKVFIKSL
ncbi:MAG: amino-acid N-acetyltransferase [Gammaproteobacteria bacterium]